VEGGAPDRALALILRSVEIDPHFVIAQYILGTMHQALKNRWKAAVQFRLCTLDPFNPRPHLRLGTIYRNQTRCVFNAARLALTVDIAASAI
jgi:hypothetical protein